MKSKTIDFKIFKFKPTWKLIFSISIVLSLISLFISFKYNIILAYSDARAHMNIARLVTDNLKPGLAQLGSVWLPLTHVLTMTLVWNDWLWQTGLAGAVFSMIAYILASLYVYGLIN